MVRVVLDTNVYVSAFNFDGIPLEILVLGIRKEIDILISPSILKEIEGFYFINSNGQSNNERKSLLIFKDLLNLFVYKKR